MTITLDHDLPRAPPASTVAPPPKPPPPPAPPPPRRAWGLAAAVAVAVLGLGFSPMVAVSSWTIRAAAVVVLAAAAPRLLWLSFSGPHRRAAAAATSLLAIASGSAALAAEPILAVTGRYAQGTGLVFILGLAGAWALGALAAGHRRRVTTMVLVVAGVNGAVGLLQATGVLELPGTVLTDGRAPGLLGNPVQLAAVLVGGLALVAGTTWRVPAAGTALAFTMAVALQATGSRYGLAAAAIVAMAAVVQHRNFAGILLAAAIAAGSFAGTALLAGSAIDTASAGGLERLVDGGSGMTTRLGHWTAAGTAIAQRPLLGSGPGTFLAAVTPHRSESLARAMPPEQLFTDAHNIAVEYAVTTGLLGLAALGVWLVLAGRAAAGPLLWFALAVLGAHLLQPQMVGTTPLAFLALGAAGPSWRPPPARIPGRLATVVMVVVGVAAGTGLVVGDQALERARLDFDRSDALLADAVFPFWAEPADARARIDLLTGLHDPAAAETGVALVAETARRDSAHPRWWNRLGETLVVEHDFAGAQNAFTAALAADPFSVRAMLGMASLSLALDDTVAATGWAERARSVHDIAPVDEMLLRIEAAGG